MSLNTFSILKKQGKKFSKISGDHNKIHIDEKTGYNSIFGNNICHGILIVLKFLKKINFKKKHTFNLNIKFTRPFYYNSKITYIKKFTRNKIEYTLLQNNKNKAKFIISNNTISKNFNLTNAKKKQYKFNINKNYYNNLNKDFVSVLLNISKYVGMIYPGENSIINSLDINYNSKINIQDNIIKIKSNLIDNRLPLIKNKLTYNNFFVLFDTAIRPVVKNKKIVINKNILERIKLIKENIFIIGASQGIGKDIFFILNKNKKIKKIISYYKNRIKIKGKNIITKKIDIEKNIFLINKIIKKYSPIRIYYFPTTKIYFDDKIKKDSFKEYEKYYIKKPLQILKNNKNRRISFFYPSTKNIESNNKSAYSRIKLKAEIKIKKFCYKNKIKAYIHRYPAINSRQSVSLSNTRIPNLTEYLNNNKESINEIFPKNIKKE